MDINDSNKNVAKTRALVRELFGYEPDQNLVILSHVVKGTKKITGGVIFDGTSDREHTELACLIATSMVSLQRITNKVADDMRARVGEKEAGAFLDLVRRKMIEDGASAKDNFDFQQVKLGKSPPEPR